LSKISKYESEEYIMNDVYSWANDLYPLVTKRFDLDYAMYTNTMKAVIGEETTDRVDVREEGIGGYGEVPDYDGSTIPELNQKRGFVSIYTPKEKLAKVTVSYKKAKVDMSGEAAKTGSRLSGSIGMTKLMDFYRLFANGFNGAYVGADGKSLFATDHAINNETGAGTYSNLLTDAFSISAVTKAQTQARRFLTPDGFPFLCKYDLVLVSPELEPKAREYFGKEAKLLPDSPNNNANPVGEMKYFVIDGFSAKQFAVGDARLIKEMMKCVTITKPQVTMQKAAANPYFNDYFVYSDYTMGWSDNRQLIGFNPA
jgi:hypothetical protein